MAGTTTPCRWRSRAPTQRQVSRPARILRTVRATARPCPWPGYVHRRGRKLEQRQLRLQVRRDTADRHRSVDRPAGRKGLVPEAASRSVSPARMRRPGSRPVRHRPGTPARIIAKAAVVGSCRDAAGNSAEAGQAFQYDATAPALRKTEAKVDKGVARDRLGACRRRRARSSSSGARDQRRRSRRSSTRGNGAAFVDKTVRAGIRYRYEISVERPGGQRHDEGGHATAGTASALYGPAAGAVVKAPPLLRWKAVPRATFYNVQLYRNGVKVLSTWPGSPRAAARPRHGRTAAGDAAIRARQLPLVCLGRARHAREARLTEKCSARARSPSSADSYSKARPRRESSWSA